MSSCGSSHRRTWIYQRHHTELCKALVWCRVWTKGKNPGASGCQEEWQIGDGRKLYYSYTNNWHWFLYTSATMATKIKRLDTWAEKQPKAPGLIGKYTQPLLSPVRQAQNHYGHKLDSWFDLAGSHRTTCLTSTPKQKNMLPTDGNNILPRSELNSQMNEWGECMGCHTRETCG